MYVVIIDTFNERGKNWNGIELNEKKELLKLFFGFFEIKVWDVIVCLKISGEIEAVWW